MPASRNRIALAAIPALLILAVVGLIVSVVLAGLVNATSQ
jgi:hypothetical protein